jgi:pimeloyl-ACP methyl ester carboxylesterase
MSYNRHNTGLGSSARSLAAVMLVLAAPATGCTTLRYALTSGGQVQRLLQLGRIEGRIDTEAPIEGPLVVVLARPGETESQSLVDTFVRPGPGRFTFAVTPGRYDLAAYEDRNESGRVDPGEPMWPNRGALPLEVGPGQVTRQHIVLDLHATARRGVAPIDGSGGVVRAPRGQPSFSPWAGSAQGVVCPDLRDARYGHEAAVRGIWHPMDFLSEGLAGVYFLAPYDPARVPVLFVHGIGGSPQQFLPLARSLDPERFQAWFYFYPSGYSLDGISDHLASVLARLEVTYGFEELAIVAHSMGGLVSRGAILKHAHPMEDRIRLFITLATPWGGGAAPREAAFSTMLPPSFEDMSPSSDYLRRLFYADDGRARALPDETSFHLLIGFRMKVLATFANDGRVSVSSQARLEAQEQAASVRALDVSHTDILTSPDAIARVNELLEERSPSRSADHIVALADDGPGAAHAERARGSKDSFAAAIARDEGESGCESRHHPAGPAR